METHYYNDYKLKLEKSNLAKLEKEWLKLLHSKIIPSLEGPLLKDKKDIFNLELELKVVLKN